MTFAIFRTNHPVEERSQISSVEASSPVPATASLQIHDFSGRRLAETNGLGPANAVNALRSSMADRLQPAESAVEAYPRLIFAIKLMC
jgi:hypothetical protein